MLIPTVFTPISSDTTDIDRRSQNLPHLYPGWGFNWGIQVFLAIKITVNSSGAYVWVSECDSKYA